MLGDFVGILSGSEEYKYESEPSTRPVVESVYEVARLGEGSEEICRRSPNGVGKSSSARAHSQHPVIDGDGGSIH
jgi:hypothetical protein